MRFAFLPLAVSVALSAQLASAAPTLADHLLSKRFVDTNIQNTNTTNDQHNDNSNNNGYSANQSGNYSKATDNA